MVNPGRTLGFDRCMVKGTMWTKLPVCRDLCVINWLEIKKSSCKGLYHGTGSSRSLRTEAEE
ncbi:hypothetical protein Hanom_Chr10g00959211 [Helianthus anomalus]